MKFSITSNIAEQARGMSDRIQQRVAAETPELLETAGLQILSNAQLDYRTKSQGGTGTDGIQWKPLDPKTINRKNGRKGARKKDGKKTKSGKALPGLGASEIGVDSGLQRASASPGFVGPDGKGGNLMAVEANSVTVGFNREYSEYFDEDRPLLPEVLPEAWQEQLDGIAQEWLDDIVTEESEG